MLARLRENISFKLFALVVAILLHMYVSNQQSPNQSHDTYSVQLNIKNVPAGDLLINKPGSVMVTIAGSSDEIARISEMNFAATVDLRHAHTGVNTGLPVDVEVTPAAIKSSISYEVKPRTVTLQLDERRERRMSISVEVTGVSATGLVARRPSLLVPSLATVTGPATEVDSISRLVIRPDITGARDSVDEDYPIIPLDAQGDQVTSVQVTPETAHVLIDVVDASHTKAVFVTPSIVGTPAPGYIVGGVAIKPETLPLTGGLDQLSAIDSLPTEPIIIQNAAADFSKQVRCVAPAGVKFAATAGGVAPPTVTVTVRIMRAGTLPTPATQPAH